MKHISHNNVEKKTFLNQAIIEAWFFSHMANVDPRLINNDLAGVDQVGGRTSDRANELLGILNKTVGAVGLGTQSTGVIKLVDVLDAQGQPTRQQRYELVDETLGIYNVESNNVAGEWQDEQTVFYGGAPQRLEDIGDKIDNSYQSVLDGINEGISDLLGQITNNSDAQILQTELAKAASARDYDLIDTALENFNTTVNDLINNNLDDLLNQAFDDLSDTFSSLIDNGNEFSTDSNGTDTSEVQKYFVQTPAKDYTNTQLNQIIQNIVDDAQSIDPAKTKEEILAEEVDIMLNNGSLIFNTELAEKIQDYIVDPANGFTDKEGNPYTVQSLFLEVSEQKDLLDYISPDEFFKIYSDTYKVQSNEIKKIITHIEDGDPSNDIVNQASKLTAKRSAIDGEVSANFGPLYDSYLTILDRIQNRGLYRSKVDDLVNNFGLTQTAAEDQIAREELTKIEVAKDEVGDLTDFTSPAGAALRERILKEHIEQAPSETNIIDDINDVYTFLIDDYKMQLAKYERNRLDPLDPNYINFDEDKFISSQVSNLYAEAELQLSPVIVNKLIETRFANNKTIYEDFEKSSEFNEIVGLRTINNMILADHDPTGTNLRQVYSDRVGAIDLSTGTTTIEAYMNSLSDTNGDGDINLTDVTDAGDKRDIETQLKKQLYIDYLEVKTPKYYEDNRTLDDLLFGRDPNSIDATDPTEAIFMGLNDQFNNIADNIENVFRHGYDKVAQSGLQADIRNNPFAALKYVQNNEELLKDATEYMKAYKAGSLASFTPVGEYLDGTPVTITEVEKIVSEIIGAPGPTASDIDNFIGGATSSKASPATRLVNEFKLENEETAKKLAGRASRKIKTLGEDLYKTKKKLENYKDDIARVRDGDPELTQEEIENVDLAVRRAVDVLEKLPLDELVGLLDESNGNNDGSVDQTEILAFFDTNTSGDVDQQEIRQGLYNAIMTDSDLIVGDIEQNIDFLISQNERFTEYSKRDLFKGDGTGISEMLANYFDFDQFDPTAIEADEFYRKIDDETSLYNSHKLIYALEDSEANKINATYAQRKLPEPRADGSFPEDNTPIPPIIGPSPMAAVIAKIGNLVVEKSASVARESREVVDQQALLQEASSLEAVVAGYNDPTQFNAIKGELGDIVKAAISGILDELTDIQSNPVKLGLEGDRDEAIDDREAIYTYNGHINYNESNTVIGTQSLRNNYLSQILSINHNTASIPYPDDALEIGDFNSPGKVSEQGLENVNEDLTAMINIIDSTEIINLQNEDATITTQLANLAEDLNGTTAGTGTPSDGIFELNTQLSAIESLPEVVGGTISYEDTNGDTITITVGNYDIDADLLDPATGFDQQWQDIETALQSNDSLGELSIPDPSPLRTAMIEQQSLLASFRTVLTNGASGNHTTSTYFTAGGRNSIQNIIDFETNRANRQTTINTVEIPSLNTQKAKLQEAQRLVNLEIANVIAEIGVSNESEIPTNATADNNIQTIQGQLNTLIEDNATDILGLVNSTITPQLEQDLEDAFLENFSDVDGDGVSDLKQFKNVTDSIDKLTGNIERVFGNNKNDPSKSLQDQGLRRLLLIMFFLSLIEPSSWEYQRESADLTKYQQPIG